MRRVLHEGQTPRPLQEKGISGIFDLRRRYGANCCQTSTPLHLMIQLIERHPHQSAHNSPYLESYPNYQLNPNQPIPQINYPIEPGQANPIVIEQMVTRILQP